jgi:phosphate starvation-inducible protein PhoH
MKYIAYVTPWSEGVVVVREDDLKFAMGYEPTTGSTVYSENFDFEKEIVEETESILRAVELDSALYTRYGRDNDEVDKYNSNLEDHIYSLAQDDF